MTYDPMEGVNTKTPKEELMERLRKAAAALRKQDRTKKAKLAEIEQRLREKGAQRQERLVQVIASATPDEWKEAISFLEDFEAEGLLPVSLQRLAVGGRVLLGQIEASG